MSDIFSNQEEFWHLTFEKSDQPISFYKKETFKNFDHYLDEISASNDITQGINNTLQKFPVFKGEFFITAYIESVLTNYRLLQSVNGVCYSIPLNNIRRYVQDDNGVNITFDHGGTQKDLLFGTYILPNILQNTKGSFDPSIVNPKILEILEWDRAKLNSNAPNFNIPPVGVPTPSKKYLNGKKLKKFGKVGVFLVCFVFLFKWCSNENPSPDNNSNEVRPERELATRLDNSSFTYTGQPPSKIEFVSENTGWFGAAILTQLNCKYVYSYTLEGNKIILTFTQSDCGQSSGDRTFYYNKNGDYVYVVINGQEYQFK